MSISKTGANYVYSIIYRLSICVLPLVVTPYIARVIGAENNGVYVLTSVVACVFIMLGKLGLDNYGNRTIAAYRDDPEKRSRLFFGMYFLQLAASLLSLAAYAVFVSCFVREYRVVYWVQMLYVMSVLLDVSWFFYGMEQFRLTTIRSLISRVLIIAGVFLLVKSRDDLILYTAVMSVCFLLEQAMLFPFVFKYVHRVKITLKDITCHIKPNFTLFVPILALSVYHWMDKIMLGYMVDASNVSYYNYAESFINLPKGVVQALGTVMLPHISYMVAHGRRGECAPLFENCMELVCMIGCALSFGIFGVSPVFVPMFLGPEYLPTIQLTMELAIVMIFMTVSDVIQTLYLIPFKRDKIYVWSIILGAAVNLVLNICLIPPLGATGAIIGTLGAEIAVCLYQLFCVRDFYPGRRLLRDLGPYMIFGAAEAAVALLLKNLPLGTYALLAVQVAAAGGVYLLLCAGYLTFKKHTDPDFVSPFAQLRREPDGGSETAAKGGGRT